MEVGRHDGQLIVEDDSPIIGKPSDYGRHQQVQFCSWSLRPAPLIHGLGNEDIRRSTITYLELNVSTSASTLGGIRDTWESSET
jgi:hypothetical protein